MDPMIKNSFFTILIYWNDNRIHLGLTKKLIFFILFPPLLIQLFSDDETQDLKVSLGQKILYILIVIMVLVSVLKISSNIGRDLFGEMPGGDHQGEVALASKVSSIFVELKSCYSVIVLNSSPLVMFWSLVVVVAITIP